MDEKQKKKDNQLKRGLNRRHLQMIAIGGSIGTGLFLASGRNHPECGPRWCHGGLCHHGNHCILYDDSAWRTCHGVSGAGCFYRIRKPFY